ncbi:MAG TPA: ATP synthase F1 subunit gamma [Phycisphaerae bacterium]|nr:ATP synthase F1 subunit gamma [Phycisphaerae bacterium]HRW52553.1 ATP synthase F1 subunit gamma [Phycisphaerae bacterium]
MANARQIVKRRKAVSNTRKITRTMQLIATARFQQAFNRATATKPYTSKITRLVQELSSAAEGGKEHYLMRENSEATKDVILVLSSNRGLCGGYNANILRTFEQFVRGKDDGRENEMHVVGKKGIAYCRFFGHKVTNPIRDIDDRPRFEQVEPLAASFMERYRAGEIANVYVVYMRFISAGKQVPEVMHLLPLRKEESGESAGGSDASSVQYDFSPAPEELLEKLLPQTVKTRLYQAFTDMAVSENVARMIAMKAATDAAGDMIKTLSRQYNRARQTQITMELLDIVGGAEALK